MFYTHTYMNTVYIIIAIVELIENITLFFVKVFVFCHISRVYVACPNFCCIIVELTSKVLLFMEPRKILFIHSITENYLSAENDKEPEIAITNLKLIREDKKNNPFFLCGVGGMLIMYITIQKYLN